MDLSLLKSKIPKTFGEFSKTTRGALQGANDYIESVTPPENIPTKSPEPNLLFNQPQTANPFAVNESLTFNQPANVEKPFEVSTTMKANPPEQGIPKIGVPRVKETVDHALERADESTKALQLSLSAISLGKYDDQVKQNKDKVYTVIDSAMKILDERMAEEKEAQYQKINQKYEGLSGVDRGLNVFFNPEYRVWETTKYVAGESAMRTFESFERAVMDNAGAIKERMDNVPILVSAAPEPTSWVAKHSIMGMGYYVDILERPKRKYLLPSVFTGTNLVNDFVFGGADWNARNLDMAVKRAEYWAGGSISALPRLIAVLTNPSPENVSNALNEFIETESGVRDRMIKDDPWLEVMEELEIWPGFKAISLNDMTISLIASLWEAKMAGGLIGVSGQVANPFVAKTIKGIGVGMEGLSRMVWPLTGVVAATKGGFVDDEIAQWYADMAEKDIDFAQDASVLEGMFYLGGLLKGLGISVKGVKTEVPKIAKALNDNEALARWDMEWAQKQIGSHIEFMYRKSAGAEGKLKVSDVESLKKAWQVLPDWLKTQMNHTRI